ncbi:ATP-binding protein [Verrucomicrobiota bacterium sgz303538]
MPNEVARVLLVDDRQDKLLAMEAVLARPELEIVKAHSGREALKLTEELDFAVILLDVHMPIMDGFQTAALIRQQPRSRITPIIFITATASEELVTKGYSLGAVDYIKEIVPDILRAKVAVLIELYKKRTDLTALERARRVLHAQYSVTQLLSEAAKPHDVLEKVLQTVGENFGWEWCAWWTPEGTRLKCTAIWHAASCPADKMQELSQSVIFEHEGLPGRVNVTQEPLWVPDLGKDHVSPRSGVAAEEGWRGAVGIPVIFEGELLGVMECFSRRARSEDEIMLATLAGIGNHIGQAFAINQMKARKRAIFEASLDSIITIDWEDRIIEWNPAAERMFGYSRQQALGKKMTDLIVPPRWRERYRESLMRLLEARDTKLLGKRLEKPALRADGTEFPAEFSVARIDPNGTPLFTAYVRDITDRRNDEKKLRDTATHLAESNADLAQFAYVASHDLQEPLRAVAGCVQLLQERYADKLDEPANQLINHAVEGARRMHTLIEDLLAYSRVGTEGKPFESIDSSAILAGVIANLEAVIREHDAEITHEELPTVMADPTQMTQLLQNLISNGIKFCTDHRPQIHIAAERDNGKWRFSVRDNGIGIPPQFTDRIFLIFQRLHTRKEFPGSGIGLAMCKKIVERHGGRIWVESQPGKGSTFYFTLPAAKP